MNEKWKLSIEQKTPEEIAKEKADKIHQEDVLGWFKSLIIFQIFGRDQDDEESDDDDDDENNDHRSKLRKRQDY